jgi:simple sugar transport system ATP-binding protein
MAELMMGANLVMPERRAHPIEGRPLLVVRDLDLVSPYQHGTDLRDIGFEVRAGEILGVAGIAGNGQRELMGALIGEVLAEQADTVIIDGEPVGRSGPSRRRIAGFGFVPEERLGHGAVPQMTLWENAFLSASARLKLLDRGFLKVRRSSEYAARVVEGFRVKTPGVGNAAASLSGGNLQKFIIGREILQDPGVIVALQPTWGVDAGSAAAIRQALIDLAAKGAAVLVVSQDLEELFEIADTIAVISGGRLSTPRPAGELTVEEIGLMMGGVHGAGANGAAGAVVHGPPA